MQGFPEKEVGFSPSHPSVVLDVKVAISVCIEVNDDVFVSENLVYRSSQRECERES